MILPVYLYGNSVLRKKTEPISADYPELKTLIDNMYETMYNANGVGLAAPQVGLDIRLLVIDLKPYLDEDPELGSFKVAMINPEILEMSEETEILEEGCLSIPGIQENVPRSIWIKVRYFDADFNEHIEEITNYQARVVQHEYDHLEGKLFTDKVSPIRRQLVKSKLTSISKGKVACRYKVKN